jgi:hypothetical protein
MVTKDILQRNKTLYEQRLKRWTPFDAPNACLPLELAFCSQFQGSGKHEMHARAHGLNPLCHLFPFLCPFLVLSYSTLVLGLETKFSQLLMSSEAS